MPKYKLVIKNLEETVEVPLETDEITYVGTYEKMQPRAMNLTKGKYDCAIQINDSSRTMSSEHGRFYYEGTNLFYEDLESTNGTMIREGSRLLPYLKTQIKKDMGLILGRDVTISVKEIPEEKSGLQNKLEKPKITSTQKPQLKKPEDKPMIKLRNSELDSVLKQVRVKPK